MVVIAIAFVGSRLAGTEPLDAAKSGTKTAAEGVGKNVTETALSNNAPATTGTSAAAGFWDKISPFDLVSQVAASLNPELGAALSFLRGGIVDSTNKFVGAGGMIQNLVHHYGKFKATEELERFARKNGMTLAELNLALIAMSFVGNKLVGTRFYEDDFLGTHNDRRPGHQGIEGILSRDLVNINQKPLISKSFFNRPIGLIFDLVDIALGFQGLITASGYDAIRRGDPTKMIRGFSLGSMDANNLVSRGYYSSGLSQSFVFGNVSHSNVNVELGALDIVNGGILGILFNPGAKLMFKNKGCILHEISGCY